jgi:hypothetical protein
VSFKDIYYKQENREYRKDFRLGIHGCYFSILDLAKNNDVDLQSVEFTVKVNGEDFISLGLNGKIEP